MEPGLPGQPGGPQDYLWLLPTAFCSLRPEGACRLEGTQLSKFWVPNGRDSWPLAQLAG